MWASSRKTKDGRALRPVRPMSGGPIANSQKPMKKRQRKALAELREGRPTLNDAEPPAWLTLAVGPDVALAAEMFEAAAIEMSEGVTIRLTERARRAA